MQAKKVRCLDANGQEIGVIDFTKAFHLGKNRQLDLVELSPDSNPPVVKLMDYGKFLYEKKKKSRDNKKSAKSKEIQLHVNISKADLETKINKAKQFLQQKSRLKISLRFRGRENAHTNLGIELFNEVIEELQDYGVLESQPQSQGANISMVFSPKSSI